MIKKKKDTIKSLAIHSKDVGSAEIQIGLLTDKITKLSEHFKRFKKDKHSSLGLTKSVNKRKKLLSYLKKKNVESYQKVIKQNYGDIQVGSETEYNPVDGYISMLRYFDHAIGNNIIQDILHKGPNLKMEGDEVTNAIPPYLSVNWYLDKAQNTA